MERDARSLPATAQEDLRCRVMRALRGGLGISAAARTFRVSRQAIYGWKVLWKNGGPSAMKPRSRGRPRRIQLKPHQAATAVRLIVGRCPDQLRLPFMLWTRNAVRLLFERRFGIVMSIWTVGRYLAHWGLTPQKPLRRAFEQNPRAVAHWLRIEYPAIRAKARREGAEIHWGDEMGVRSDHQAGTSYGRMGITPVVPGTGLRFRCNMISTVTNRGKLSFMVFTARFTNKIFLVFLGRLLRHSGRKIFLIVDRHPVHRAKQIRAWLDLHRDQISLYYLPPYSPSLNPDEYLNQDVKSNAVGRKRPRNTEELLRNVRGYLRGTKNKPNKVKRYFEAKSVQYAAEV